MSLLSWSEHTFVQGPVNQRAAQEASVAQAFDRAGLLAMGHDFASPAEHHTLRYWKPCSHPPMHWRNIVQRRISWQQISYLCSWNIIASTILLLHVKFRYVIDRSILIITCILFITCILNCLQKYNTKRTNLVEIRSIVHLAEG